MKIAILTLTLHTNYGGILQAYALQTILERMGHEVEVLNRPFTPSRTKWKEIPKRIIKKLLGRDVIIFSEKKYNKEAPIINKAVWDFRKKYIHERIINNLHDVKEYDYECIVVGSDQVWRPKYFKQQWKTGIEDAYLAFTKGWNIKRIAYACSFGVDTWEYTDEETAKCREAIKMFDAVSVREDSGIELMKLHLDIDAVQMIDPTMILERKDYELIIGEDSRNQQQYLLTYILDRNPEKETTVEKYRLAKQIKRFDLNYNQEITEPIQRRILPSVGIWLKGFRDACIVLTDSFHGCVFSIIFLRPFAVMKNEGRGISRVDSLLKKFELQSHLINNMDGHNAYDDFICYDNQDSRIESLRRDAKVYFSISI